MLCWIYSVVEILPICRVLKILYGDVCWFYDLYILKMYVLYPLRLLRNFIYACCFEIFCRCSVYFLNIALFACFIALIEVGRYRCCRHRQYQSQLNEFIDQWKYQMFLSLNHLHSQTLNIFTRRKGSTSFHLKYISVKLLLEVFAVRFGSVLR